MSKRRNLTIESSKQEETNIDVDLAPMLALMVTLIPIMLLSTVFVRITLIETPLPQVVEKAIQEDRDKEPKEVQVVVTMFNQGIKFQIMRDGKEQKVVRLPKNNNQWDLDGLYSAAYQTKMTYPQVFHVDLKPDVDVKYEDIVKVIDKLRKIESKDKKAQILDKDTLQKIETDLMFPEINFANVVEG